jgi:hypothetical protein
MKFNKQFFHSPNLLIEMDLIGQFNKSTNKNVFKASCFKIVENTKKNDNQQSYLSHGWPMGR